MKRLHVHVAVDDLADSIGFYESLFGAAPTVRKPDYAKWRLDDPRMNFAISARGRKPGVDHLGIEVDDAGELQEVSARLAAAGRAAVEQKQAACCYARSDKAWVVDPQGLGWETFLTYGEHPVYGDGDIGEDALKAGAVAAKAGACCPEPESCCSGPA